MPKYLPSRLIQFALVIAILPLLAACGDDDDSEPTEAAAIAAPTRALEAAQASATASPGSPESPEASEGTPAASTPAVATPMEPAPAGTPADTVGSPAAQGEESEVRSILEASSQRLAETNSLHFSLSVDGTTYIDDGRTIQLDSAEGNVVRPDKVQASFKAEIQGLAISTIRLITVGDQSWTTNIITGDWEPAPSEFGYDATVLFSDTEGLGYVMLNAVDPVKLPDEELNGRGVYRIQTTGDAALIGPVTSDTMLGYPVGIDIWIDKETYDVVKVVLVEAPTPEKDEPATWTLDLSRQNEEITIVPPEVEGESALSSLR